MLNVILFIIKYPDIIRIHPVRKFLKRGRKLKRGVVLHLSPCTLMVVLKRSCVNHATRVESFRWWCCGGDKRVDRTFNLSLRGKSLIEEEVRQLCLDTASSWITPYLWETCRNFQRSQLSFIISELLWLWYVIDF